MRQVHPGLAYELTRLHPRLRTQIADAPEDSPRDYAFWVDTSDSAQDADLQLSGGVLTANNPPTGAATLYIYSHQPAACFDLRNTVFKNLLVFAPNLKIVDLRGSGIRFCHATYCAALEAVRADGGSALGRGGAFLRSSCVLERSIVDDIIQKQLDLVRAWHPFLARDAAFRRLKQAALGGGDAVFVVNQERLIVFLENQEWKQKPKDFETFSPSFGLDALPYAGATLFALYRRPCAFVQACSSGLARAIVNAPNCAGNVCLAGNRLEYCDVSACGSIHYVDLQESVSLEIQRFRVARDVQVRPSNLFAGQIAQFPRQGRLFARFPWLRFDVQFQRLSQLVAANESCIFVVTSQGIVVYFAGSVWQREPDDFQEFWPNIAIDDQEFGNGFLFCQFMESCDWLQFKGNKLTEAVINAPNCRKNVILCNNSLEFVDCAAAQRLVYVNVRGNPKLDLKNVRSAPKTQIVI